MADSLSHILSSSSEPKAGETTPGDNEQVRWQVVARTDGLLKATIIAGRLQAEGIPTRVWQEGAGRALGLTVGLLGTGHVLVPEAFVEQARDVLAAEEDTGDLDNEEEEE